MIEQAPALDRHWHLGQNQEELISAGFEYALMRCIESFNDWQQECLAAVAGHKVSATDNVVLHITRMNDRPKSVTELSKLMNRSDLSNLKYSIRKLVEAGLLEKVSEGGKRKGMRSASKSTPIPTANGWPRWSASVRRRARNSLCCRRRTPPETGSRWCSGCRSVWSCSAGPTTRRCAPG